MTAFELLDFDTELFGFKVAKIVPSRMGSSALAECLDKMRLDHVRLAFWASDSHDTASQNAAIKLNGFLADNKVTYLVRLSDLDQESLYEARAEVEEYPFATANRELKHLAVSIGIRSRFGIDPNLPNALMEKMYHSWISNSVKGVIAKHVYIMRHGEKMAGMVTLGEKKKRGDIGLIAVSEAFQGQGVGKKLVLAALGQFLAEGYQQVQVVTQVQNKTACKLYEKVGFQMENVENFYHFWL